MRCTRHKPLDNTVLGWMLRGFRHLSLTWHLIADAADHSNGLELSESAYRAAFAAKVRHTPPSGEVACDGDSLSFTNQ